MLKKQAITIQDIARKAGVSPSTVSRALNETGFVASDKKEAILAAIDELGYRPNIMAQNLVRGRSLIIGVLTQDISSPFYGQIHRGIEQGLQGTLYQPMFISGNWLLPQELLALDTLMMRKVDGIISLGSNIAAERLLEVAGQLPFIIVGRSIKGLEPHCLQINNVKAGYEATRHLIQLGHRRIVHIMGLSNHGDASERRAGYCQALEEAQIPIDPQLIVEGNFNRQSGLLAIDSLLSRGVLFTAIFSANDQMAYGARLALYRRGIRVPEDVSMVGFDDQEQSAYLTPPLTTVRQPMVEMGRMAAEAILKLIDGQTVTFPTLSAQLIIRESTTMYN